MIIPSALNVPELFTTAFFTSLTPFADKIIVPLSVPALASYSIFQFLWVWNDLIVALYIGPFDNTDLVFPIRLEKQLGTFGDQLHLLNASAVISMVIPVLVFLSMQRYFIRGLLAGSVKGG